MTSAQAIILGSIAIAASVLGARALAPYHIAAGKNLDGSPIVWRLNAITGKIQFCTVKNVLISNHPQSFPDPSAVRGPCD